MFGLEILVLYCLQRRFLCKDDFCAKTTFRRPLLCDGVYAGEPTAGIVNSALGSLRAEVAERGTQITQPPCTSTYVR